MNISLHTITSIEKHHTTVQIHALAADHQPCQITLDETEFRGLIISAALQGLITLRELTTTVQDTARRIVPR